MDAVEDARDVVGKSGEYFADRQGLVVFPVAFQHPPPMLFEVLLSCVLCPEFGQLGKDECLAEARPELGDLVHEYAQGSVHERHVVAVDEDLRAGKSLGQL